LADELEMALFEEPTMEEIERAQASFRHGVMDVVIGGVNVGGLALAAYLGEPLSKKLLGNLVNMIQVFCADLAEKDAEAFATWKKLLSTGAEGAVLMQTRAMVKRLVKEALEKDL
jgi:hypothetical protein